MNEETKRETLELLEDCAYFMAHKISRKAQDQDMCLDDDDIERVDYLTHTLKSIASINMAGEYGGESYGYSERRRTSMNGHSMDGYSERRGRDNVTGRYVSRESESNRGVSRRGRSYDTEHEQTIKEIERLLENMKA